MSQPLLDIVPSISDESALVSEFISLSRVRNIEKLREILPQSLVDLISAVPIPRNAMDDNLFWRLTASGEFSTKSTALLAQVINPDNI